MKEFTASNLQLAAVPLLERLGNLIEGRAKELCPVDTGRLRASITHKVSIEKMEVNVGTNVPYAKHVEFMYDIRHPHPGRETGQMPFLRPALFQLKPEIDKEVTRFFNGIGSSVEKTDSGGQVLQP
jgi:hypothetical protein